MNGDSLVRGLIIFLIMDIVLILLIWIVFYGLPLKEIFKRIKEIRLPEHVGNPINVLIAFDQFFSTVTFQTKAILVLGSFVIGLLSTWIWPLLIIIPLFWPLLIEALLKFPSYWIYSTAYRFLPPTLREAIGEGNNLVDIGWLLYFPLGTSIVFTKRSFWLILYLLFIFLLINNVAGCRENISTFPDG